MKSNFSSFLKSIHVQLDTSSLSCRNYVSLLYLVALTLVISAIAKIGGVGFYNLLADPNEIAHQPPYFGFFSILGWFIWCSTSAICLFSALVLHQMTDKSSLKVRLFLIYSGLLTAQLLIDDTFQFHEYFSTLLYGLPLTEISRSAQNLAEGLVLGLYAAEFLGLVFIFRKIILQSELLFAWTAIVCFLMSIILDMTPESINSLHILEDYFKLFGIFNILMYYLVFCQQQLKSLLKNSTA